MRASRHISGDSPAWRPALSLTAAAMFLAAACGSGAGGDGEGATVALRLLAINDFHGHLEPRPDGLGGIGYLASHLRRLGSEEPGTFVVSAGDNIGASPLLSALFDDAPTLEAFDEVGVDASAVGNHELDEGPESLVRRAGAFPYLAANVTWEATGEALFAPFRLVTVDGVRVAFVGVTLQGAPSVVVASGTAGLAFADEADVVNRLVPGLVDRGVEAIVVLVHEGGETEGECGRGLTGPIVDIASRFDDAVDVVVSGHTNRSYVCPVDGKLVTSTSSFGEEVTVIDATLSRETGDVVDVAGRQHAVSHGVRPDPAMTALLGRYRPQAAERAQRPVGSLPAPLKRGRNRAGESPLGDWTADAHLAATRPDAVVAFVNQGGIRADLPAGPVTYADLFATAPFPDQLITMTLTGAQIVNALEGQWARPEAEILGASDGFTYTWHAGAPPGRRVDAVRLDGRPLVAGAPYRVTVNSFLAGGGDGFGVFAEGTDRQGGPAAIDALEAHLARGGRPPAGSRVRRAP